MVHPVRVPVWAETTMAHRQPLADLGGGRYQVFLLMMFANDDGWLVVALCASLSPSNIEMATACR